jgi:hypothetical protein
MSEADAQVSDEQKPDDVDTEASALAVEMGGNKMVPLSALIGVKRELKARSKELDDMRPIAARATEIEEKLNLASPFINALNTSPQLRAEAARIVEGKPTSARVEQPTEQDDPDAVSLAEEMGLMLGDGVTPDVVKGRRLLNVLDKRHGRQTAEQLRPLAGSVLGSRAEQNVAFAMQQTRDDGAPLATRESIQEAVTMLGGPNAPLLANPQVADVLITMAVGIDGRKGRSPKVPDEPIYVERQGGRRVSREPVMDDGLKAALERTGVKIADAEASIGKLVHVGRRGVEFGGS